MTTRKPRAWWVLLLLFALAGCGQKGPLYLDDTDDTEEEEQSALPVSISRVA